MSLEHRISITPIERITAGGFRHQDENLMHLKADGVWVGYVPRRRGKLLICLQGVPEEVVAAAYEEAELLWADGKVGQEPEASRVPAMGEELEELEDDEEYLDQED